MFPVKAIVSIQYKAYKVRPKAAQFELYLLKNPAAQVGDAGQLLENLVS